MKMKKLLSLLTAAAMAASCAAGMAVTANAAVGDYPYSVVFSSFTDAASTTLENSVIKDAENAALFTVEYPGTWKVSGGAISPVDKPNRPTQSGGIYFGGCALIFTAEQDGTVLVDRKLLNGKTLDIDDLTDSKEVISYKNESGGSISTKTVENDVAVDVTAGHRYVAYATGTGDPFYGIYYKVATKVPSVKVTPDKTQLSLNETADLTAEVKNADGAEVVWTTSDDKIATVTGGKVTAVGVGTATIKASITVGSTTYEGTSEITVVDNATITYSMGDVTAEGTVPPANTVQKGTQATIPANRTLYVAGKTLTKWTDGTNDYIPGQSVTLNADVTVTPVFEENTASLGDADATVVFDFQTKNGAPTFALQGNTGILVEQAVIGGKTIDVKMDIDTTSGKLANASHTDWAQVNPGTKFTVPAVADSVVTVGTVMGSDGTYTINGESRTGSDGQVTIAEAGTVDIVAGNPSGSWWRTITVTYPKKTVVEPTVSYEPKQVFTANEGNPTAVFKASITAGSYTVTNITWTAQAGVASVSKPMAVEINADTTVVCGLIVEAENVKVEDITAQVVASGN